MTGITHLHALEVEISGDRSLLSQHQQNLYKLQHDKAIYAAGEAPMRLENQIAEETQRIDQVRFQLKDLFYHKLLHLVFLANLSADEISNLYRACRPSNVVKQLPLPETSTRLVELLWQMRDLHDQEIHILEFAERLARLRYESPIAAQLQTWQNDVIELELLSISPTAMADVAENIDAAKQPGDDSALLVEIAPDPGAAGTYLVRIYYWQDGGGICWHKQENDKSGRYNRTYKLQEIPNLIYRVLSEHEEKPASIEFLLPKELLIEAVDQWESDEDPVKFCSEHRIVIRSQERIAKHELSKWRQAWREKWALFNDLKQERDIFWVEPLSAYEASTLANRLVLAREKAICLGLTFLVMHHANEQERTKLLVHILRAGVPIMAWTRTPANTELMHKGVQKELSTILCKEHLDNLPMVVHQMRTDPAVLESAEHIGNRLALFWDDPDRIPEVYRR